MRAIPESIAVEGFGIRLRTPEPRDFPAIMTLLNDPRTMEHLRFMTRADQGGWTPESVRERHQRRALRQQRQECIQFVVEELANGEVVGTSGYPNIHTEHHCGEFGIILHHSHWGRGLAAAVHRVGLEYGFSQLGLHRIEFMTSVDNHRMQRFFERYGIGREGVLRERFFDLGRYVDYAVYAAFQSDWPTLRERLEAASTRYSR
jgi:RimJ/RimL family protein N-acetyltransferase